MAAGDHGWLGRTVDRLVGWFADHLLVRWDGTWARRQRRRWRHRRAVYRASMRHLRARPKLRRPVERTEAALAALARAIAWLGTRARRAGAAVHHAWLRAAQSRVARATVRLAVAVQRPLERFWCAHLDAWRWAAALPGRLLQRRRATAASREAIVDAQPTVPTMPDGVLMQSICAACGHEVIGTNLRKYARYHCPLCKCQLLVLDCQKGVTMVLGGGERGRTRTSVEKNETEESEPLRA